MRTILFNHLNLFHNDFNGTQSSDEDGSHLEKTDEFMLDKHFRNNTKYSLNINWIALDSPG